MSESLPMIVVSLHDEPLHEKHIMPSSEKIIPSFETELSSTSSLESGPKDEKPPGFLEFEPNDPEHPQNWSVGKRMWATFMIAVFDTIVTIASSIFESSQEALQKEFNVGSEVTILGTSLYLLGYVFGPLLFGPLSEKFGRKYPLIIGIFLFAIFSLMCALGHELPTILIGRFLSGFFAVASVAVFGGIITDCWNEVHRGIALAFGVGLLFSAPCFGPIIGSLIAESIGWRWTFWVVIIAALATCLLALFTFPETYVPSLLQKKAKKLRAETGDMSIRSSLDIESVQISYVARKYLIRPWRLFFTQPILVLLTIYQSFIYGLMYLFYQSYPIAFHDIRGWSNSLSTLPLLFIVLGILLGTAIVIIYNETYLIHHCHNADGSFRPESRLPLMILGGLCVPAGLFWYAWTSDASLPWAPQACAGILFGLGMFLIFIQCFTYIIDLYEETANSAMAANGAVRSICGATFPLFAGKLFNGLGVAWASSIIGFVGVAMVPIPVVFWWFAGRLRGLSK